MIRRIAFFRFPADLSPDLRSNFINFFFDIGWWGLYNGATVAFLTIYDTRLGATPQQIGLLTAIPALISLALSLPGGWIVRRMRAKRAAVAGAFLSRLLFLAYALLPFFWNPAQQVNMILLVTVLIAIPAVLVNISFNQVLMEGVPAEWRGQIVGTRNAIFSIISFAVTLLSGQILTRLPEPMNYQVVFFIGFVGGIMTSYHISRIKPINVIPVTAAPVLPAAGGQRLFPEVDEAGRRYIRLIILFFLFAAFNSMVNPLVPDLLVHELHLSDAMISLGAAMNSLVYFLASLFISSIVRRMGNRGGTALGAALIGLQAGLLAMSHDAGLYLFSTVVGGLGTGVLGTAQFNYHLENVPETDRPVWLSWNFLLSQAAVLLGALLGPLLANTTSVPAALAVFSALRLLMAVVFWRWK